MQALVGLAFSVGFTLGPLGGAWLARGVAGGAAPAACALALSLANMALVALALPETLPKVSTSHYVKNELKSVLK